MSPKRRRKIEKVTVNVKQDEAQCAIEEADQNEDDSILGSDELSDLRFSSQDGLLDSSQDGDSQCDVKWDYTSPQTMRQLRKMRGKYCDNDVKEIIAKFPDLPVTSPDTSFKNIKVMLPPKNAAAMIEKSKQLRAKQREMKILRQRQRCQKVAKDMILFLQQEQSKQEMKAAESLKTSVESSNENICDIVNKKVDVQQSTNFDVDDDFWSDDDLFTDNSFLIEATQNPEKFLNVDKKEKIAQTVTSETKAQGTSNLCSILNMNKCSNISTSSASTSAFSTGLDCLSNCVIPLSISQGGFSNSGRTKNVSSRQLAPACQTFYQSFQGKSGLSSGGSCQSKPSVACGNAQVIRVPQQNPPTNHFNKTSSHNKPSFSSPNKFQRAPMKSPFRKSLSFDVNDSPKRHSSYAKTSVPLKNVQTVNHKSRTNACVSNVPGGRNDSDQILTYEQDLFDASLSDEALLQFTLSQELALKSACDKPSTSHLPHPSAAPCKPLFNAHSVTSSKGNGKYNISDDNVDSLLLSPVRSVKSDSNFRSKVSSSSPMVQFGKKSAANGKSAIPAHMAVKHKSSLGLSSSTPVKCSRAQENECSDSFLEKAFDDSFMNDESLFESQILPMLERAESQMQNPAGQPQVPSTTSSVESPIKCSPDEIEMKRQTALKKRSMRLAQMNHRKS